MRSFGCFWLCPLTLCGLSFALMMPVTNAAEAAATNTFQTQTVEVNGASDAESRASSITTKIVVSNAELSRFNDLNLADAMRRLPGVTVTSGSGRATEVQMRGLGNGYTLILVNGDPAPPGFSIDTLSPTMVERIEIRRGATADTGGQAIAGTINIVLRKPPAKSASQLKLSIRDTKGQLSPVLDGLIGVTEGRLAMGLAANLRYDQDQRSATNHRTDLDARYVPTSDYLTRQEGNDALMSATFIPSAKYTLSDVNIVKLDGLVRLSHLSSADHERTQTLFGSPLLFSANDFSLTLRAATVNTKLGWNRKFDGGAKLEVNGAQSWFGRKTASTLTSTNSAGAQNRARDVASLTIDRGFSTVGRYLHPFGDSHSLVAGWSGSHSSRTESRTQHEREFPYLEPEDTDERTRASVDDLAVFAQDEWEVSKDVSAYVGLRWQGLATTSRISNGPNISNYFGVFSPTAQVLWTVPGAGKDQVRLAIARTFKAPKPAELSPRRYLSSNNSPTDPDAIGNPALRPELAWGIDLSYEMHFRKTGIFSASVYRRRILDVVVTRLANVDGRWVTSPENLGSASVYGLELELRSSLRQLFETAPAIDLRINAGRHWSAVRAIPGPDNRLARQTPASGSMSVEYAVPKTGVSMGVSYLFEAGGPVRLSEVRRDVRNTKRSVDGQLTWRSSPETKWNLSASNMLHPRAVSESYFIGETASVRQLTDEQSAMTWRAAVEHTF